MRHLISAASFAVIAINLLFWSVPLFLLSLVKLLPGGRGLVRAPMDGIYRTAVAIDNFWLRRVLGLKWSMPDLSLSRDTSYIVIANHRSWMDIFIIQSLVVRQGPVVKFLTKRQLIWIPVIGLICWAFDFPLLRRRTSAGGDDAARREDDRRRILEACSVLGQSPGAMLNFVEGTRFTPDKHARDARYQRLLPPRVGGLTALCGAVEGARLLDITLDYPGSPSFWQQLGGGTAQPHVTARLLDDAPEAVTADWINAFWAEKDAHLSQIDGGS